MKPRVYEQHFRQNRLPHLWCPGCGNGIVMKAIVEAIVKKNPFLQILQQKLMLHFVYLLIMNVGGILRFISAQVKNFAVVKCK